MEKRNKFRTFRQWTRLCVRRNTNQNHIHFDLTKQHEVCVWTISRLQGYIHHSVEHGSGGLILLQFWSAAHPKGHLIELPIHGGYIGPQVSIVVHGLFHSINSRFFLIYITNFGFCVKGLQFIAWVVWWKGRSFTVFWVQGEKLNLGMKNMQRSEYDNSLH